MIRTEEGPYDYVRVTVDIDGARIDYKCPELEVEGHDSLDDDNIGEWSEREIRDVVALQLGIIEGKNEIEVSYA